MSVFRTSLLVTLLLVGMTWSGKAIGQCILANPSFEISGSSGVIFGGWNQFGIVGSTSDAPHGSKAARLTGPTSSEWAVSGYWQRQDAAPGDRWSASVLVWHTSTNPLSGSSTAIVNIEWRDSGGNLISYESHEAANASTPVDQPVAFSVESGPAPTGTVSTRILLGVLQSPTDPIADVYYDVVQFNDLGPPSLDDIQWNDFPGGRTINFSGRTWRVKGPGYYGPGPNLFCDTGSCAWADAQDRLHMTIQNIAGAWYSTEVTLEGALGYGDYIFTSLGRLDTLHPNVVLGLFLWQYGPCYAPEYLWWNPYNEIDVEISRWGDPGRDIAQFVAQPYDWPGNIDRFDINYGEDELVSYAFRWLHDRVEYRSWRGGPQDEAPATLIHSWTYTGPHIPRPEQPRIHINLWQFDGPPSSNQEVILDEFTFIPDGGAVDIPDETTLTGRVTSLSLASPNPFRQHTTIRYTLASAGKADIVIYDVAGRLVRTLRSGSAPAGVSEVMWDGRDDAGMRVSSGVYLYQFRTDDAVETRRMVFLK